MSHFVAYILCYREIIVGKIPLGTGWGGGAGSQAIPRSIAPKGNGNSSE